MEAVVEGLLGDILESEEAAQRDPKLEQLNEIFEFEEAVQRDPETGVDEQWFSRIHRELIKPRSTLYRFTLSIKV